MLMKRNMKNCNFILCDIHWLYDVKANYLVLFAGIPQWHSETSAAYPGLGIPDRTTSGTPSRGANSGTSHPASTAGRKSQIQHVQGQLKDIS